jgi:hypothetical protein
VARSITTTMTGAGQVFVAIVWPWSHARIGPNAETP